MERRHPCRRPLGWDYGQFGFQSRCVGLIVAPTCRYAFDGIDRIIDDGNLNTGNFRKRSQGYINIIEQ